MPSHPSSTPQPGSGGGLLITEFFKPVHHTEPAKNPKRKLDDEQDNRPAKKLMNTRHAGTETASFVVHSDPPQPKEPSGPTTVEKKNNAGLRDSVSGPLASVETDAAVAKSARTQSTVVNQDDGTVESARQRRSLAPSPQAPGTRSMKRPSSARLLDETDGGLNAALVGYRGGVHHAKSSAPNRTHTKFSNTKGKRPASSRLLDDVDGGLADSLLGPYKTSQDKETASEAGKEKNDDHPTDDVAENESEAETIRAYDSDEDWSTSDEDDNEEEKEGGDGDDNEDNDGDKENITPRGRAMAGRYHSLSTTPRHYIHRNESPSSLTPIAPAVASDMPAPQSSP